MAVMDVKSLERVDPVNGSMFVKKHSHCTIFAASVDMVATSIERSNNNWFIQTKVPNDLIIQIEEKSFHLHKLPLVSRSGFINRMVFQNRGYGNLSLQIDNLPGGAKYFELVLKFCYGWKVNLTAKNVAPLYCAAHFLEMSDDLEQGNLISVTEAFLSYIIVSSWKDTVRIFKSCESISSWARELQILKRCSETIAWRVCTNVNVNSLEENEVYVNDLSESINHTDTNNLSDGWWFEDLSFLRIDHFVEVIESIKRKKIQPKLLGSCITHWTVKWLSGLALRHNNLNQKDLTVQMHKVTTECLIKILPAERNSVSCNFLLHLLKVAHIMKIDSELLHKLERRIALMLESCKAKDLLVKSSVTLFNVDIIAKVVEAYVSLSLCNPLSRMYAVGRLVDEYLVLVARDKSLPARSFQLLVEVLPKEARNCDDNLYRAIDTYLKAHPNLTEEERRNICRVLEYHKLSQDARKHATKNERLPVNITTQFMLLEQVDMSRAFMAAASNNQRTISQAILRVSKGTGKGWISSQKEIKIMKEDVAVLKFQVGELQQRKVELQKHMNKGVILPGWLCV
ncbi:BTB/POZ domain-containing protein DOT3 [Forsythia ovata]|uniref:BTB/POZ domain-containing protein DOT3 n=1 Tax=Forsythia ovata TaxID=205694 RepID=A0ABD1PXE9_9LAMI